MTRRWGVVTVLGRSRRGRQPSAIAVFAIIAKPDPFNKGRWGLKNSSKTPQECRKNTVDSPGPNCTNW
ncbi:hypothetical protein [Limnothrix sp. PR1529]|uniref:hypothetical protein n=1 Tax=Limnothrix sp. PR1529 TaxID=1704291 RepID=UPI0013042EE4|nr:hypothetical protein [Limnothrix sp. PR1529]